MRKLLILAGFFCLTSLHAQITFSDHTEWLGPKQFYGGLVVGISDMNGDTYEDIIRFNKDLDLHIEYSVSNQSTYYQQYIGRPTDRRKWCMAIGDIDNNGFNDIVVGGNASGVVVWMMGSQGKVQQGIKLPDSEFYAQASNLVDINADGWLDLFVCNDEGENLVYENDGTGQLNVNTSWFDFSEETANLSSGNYGSIWADVNNDGFIDLYISKCKANASSEEDLRRINQLYINGGDGTFEEMAASANLASGAQSWVTDFGDIDNDGDLDAFIANHDRPSQLMINNGSGVFTDYTDSMGVKIQGLIIQSKLVDLDNDGWLDIVTSGTSQMMFRNLGNYQFKSMSNVPSLNTVTSLAMGDLNEDGFIDLYACFPQGFVNPNIHPDKLFINDGNDNHYIQFSLEGTQDNRNGIGARLAIYGDWGVQIREVKVGESYGVTHSSLVTFGLGNHTNIDSLVIHWPSGLRESYQGLPADTRHHLIQDQCISPIFKVLHDKDLQICPGESVRLYSDQSQPVTWRSSEEMLDTVEIKTTGVYSAFHVDSDGCKSISENVFVEVDPLESLQLEMDRDSVLCAEDTLQLTVKDYDQILWSNGETSSSIGVHQTGTYFATAEGLCKTLYSDTISVRFLQADLPTVDYDDTISKPGMVTFTGSGDLLNWYLRNEDQIPAFTGSEWDILVAQTDTFYVEQVQRFPGSIRYLGEKAPVGDNLNHNLNFNGQLIFDVYTKLKLESVDVYTDIAGERTFTLASNKIVQEKTIQLDSGKNTVLLNFDLLPDINYRLSTDEDKNLEVLGTTSPQLYRTTTNPDLLPYPYGEEGYLEIKQSNFNNFNYYYFYNWKVKQEDLYCISPRVALPITVQNSTRLPTVIEDPDITIFPNPGNELMYFEKTKGTEFYRLEVYTTSGELVKSINSIHNLNYLDVSSWKAGAYWMKFINERRSFVVKFVKF